MPSERLIFSDDLKSRQWIKRVRGLCYTHRVGRHYLSNARLKTIRYFSDGLNNKPFPNKSAVKIKGEFQPCASCKTRCISPRRAVICIMSGKVWWWSKRGKRWHSCRCIPSGIFSVSAMCWCPCF